MRQRLQRQEYYYSLLCAITANYSMRAPETPFKPDDFMLTKLKPSHVKSAAEMTNAEHQSLANALRAGLSGIDGVVCIPGY